LQTQEQGDVAASEAPVLHCKQALLEDEEHSKQEMSQAEQSAGVEFGK
jgi:hypothetical protein